MDLKPSGIVNLQASSYPVVGGLAAKRLIESDVRIVITGAGGWLGSATLEMLHGLFRETFNRRVFSFGSASRVLVLRDGAEVAQHPLTALADLPSSPTLVLHLAFQTKGTTGHPADEFIEANRAIGERVRAALNRIGAEAVFLASSGAANMAYLAETAPFKRLYGSLKLEDEARFRSWGEDSGRAVVIARVFNLSGPYINNRSHYALACFIADALAGRPIAVRAESEVYRSYLATEELISVVLGVLTDRWRCCSFDAAGEVAYEMDEIARTVAHTLGHQLGVARQPLMEGRPADRYVGDGIAYRALRDEYGVSPIGLSDQIKETARYMAAYPEEA